MEVYRNMQRFIIIGLNVAGLVLLASAGWLVFTAVNPLTPPVPADVTIVDDASVMLFPSPPDSVLRSSFQPMPAPPVLPESKPTNQPEDSTVRLSQFKLTGATLAQYRSQAFPPPAKHIPNRIVLPTISVDSRVQDVGWKVEMLNGQQYSEWLVADYAVGWHKTSALPGADGNTVMAGHNNINGEVFKNLIDLKIGDEIFVFADDKVYRYAVAQKLLVKEAGATFEQRLQNAQWIAPTNDGRLTLVSCWPYSNNTHRVIIVAKPASAST